MIKRLTPMHRAGLLAVVFACVSCLWTLDCQGQEEGHGVAATGHDEHEHIGHKGGVNADPTEVKTDLAIFSLIVFLLLLGILWKFAWAPIGSALEARERHIHEELAAAERANAEAKRLLVEHEKKMAEVQTEVRAIIDEARRDAQHTQQEIMKQAQIDAQATRDRAVREIEQARDHALQELFQQAAYVATDIAAKIVRRSLNAQDHRELIAQVIKDLPSRN